LLAVVPLLLLAMVPGAPDAHAQKRPAPPKSPRLYIFENGSIKGLDPGLFRFKKEELKESDFVCISYLIVHPRGVMMWDAGAVPDSAFPPGGGPAREGIIVAQKALKPQLAAAGYTPADVNYFGLSHYHADHTANANDFTGATWIVQQLERDAMFSEKPPQIVQQAHFNKLKDAKTIVLKNQDHDVFGDGTVVVKATPGHTPGHQVLFVRLAKMGPVLLAGDLYHYPEERTTGKIPTFEFNAEQSTASRKLVEDFVKQTGAQLWIEHDIATHAKLKKAPDYYE
jgi:glyoxylase-like metal-dependent hydrolase (beta-lactamase superfamily II)